MYNLPDIASYLPMTHDQLVQARTDLYNNQALKESDDHQLMTDHADVIESCLTIIRARKHIDELIEKYPKEK